MTLKKKPQKEPNHERWLVSYGDLLTLLFAVFVVLYAMSQADKKKAEEVSASIREAFGEVNSSGSARRPAIIDSGKISVIPDIASRPASQAHQQGDFKSRKHEANENDFKAMKASIDAYLLKTGARDKVSVEITRRGLVVSLKEAGFFESGSAVMKINSTDVIDTIATVINQYSNRCRVEGHTDNVPIQSGPFDSNWDLSTARASFLVKKLVQSHGVEPKNISATGYSEYQPVTENTTPEGRAKNRRVDIVVLSSTSDGAHLSYLPPD